MTHFSTCLASAVAATGVSLREVARKAGIHSSPLSRVCSAEIPPSRAFLRAILGCLNPTAFPGLSHDYAPELLLAWLRDCAAEAGADLSTLRLSISEDPHAEWWAGLAPDLASQLRSLGHAAQVDPEFATLLSDFQPLALKLLAALHDAGELKRLREAKIYPFPADSTPAQAVAEDPVARELSRAATKKKTLKVGDVPALT